MSSRSDRNACGRSNYLDGESHCTSEGEGDRLSNHPAAETLGYLGFCVGRACTTCGHEVGSRTRLQRVWGAIYVTWSRLSPTEKGRSRWKPINGLRRLAHHRHEPPVAIRFRPRHEGLRVPAPVHDLAVGVLGRVSAALRARARRAALPVFIESDERGYLARGHGMVAGVSNTARTISCSQATVNGLSRKRPPGVSRTR